jgi:hypothetical protein
MVVRIKNYVNLKLNFVPNAIHRVNKVSAIIYSKTFTLCNKMNFPSMSNEWQLGRGSITLISAFYSACQQNFAQLFVVVISRWISLHRQNTSLKRSCKNNKNCPKCRSNLFRVGDRKNNKQKLLLRTSCHRCQYLQ